jgi:hypothetical protein
MTCPTVPYVQVCTVGHIELTSRTVINHSALLLRVVWLNEVLWDIRLHSRQTSAFQSTLLAVFCSICGIEPTVFNSPGVRSIVFSVIGQPYGSEAFHSSLQAFEELFSLPFLLCV